jgi:hypothetical protein
MHSIRKNRQGFPRRLVPLRLSGRVLRRAVLERGPCLLFGRTALRGASALPVCRANDPRSSLRVTCGDALQASVAVL